jgi:hypothetical protein
MQARYFERELIHEFDDEGNVVRLQRMTFTVDELRGIATLLAAGAGAVGYGFTANTIRDEFWEAWIETRGAIRAPK